MTMTVKLNKTTITIEETRIITSRLINGKLRSITINIDGTIKDLLAKIERVTKLDDELYRQFAELSNNTKMD